MPPKDVVSRYKLTPRRHLSGAEIVARSEGSKDMQTVTSQAIALAAILVTPGVAHSIPDWGALTPYHEVSSFGASGGIPQGCRLSQAHVLHRHTERYPTSYFLEGGQAEVLADKIATYQSAHPDTTFATGPLAFLNEWQYIFAGGGTNTLLPSGTTTAHAAGAAFWSQYGRLLYDVGTEDPFWREGLNVSAKLVFRTTSEERIVESAKWWLSGCPSDLLDSFQRKRHTDLRL